MQSNQGPTAPVSPSPTAHPIREGALDLGLTDNPGKDQIARWKAAIAAAKRQQRQRRGRRRRGVTPNGPGMIRLPPEASVPELGRCPVKGCAWRWHSTQDGRLCPQHADDPGTVATRLAAMLATPPGGRQARTTPARMPQRLTIPATPQGMALSALEGDRAAIRPSAP